MLFQHENSIAFRKLEATDLEALKDLKDGTWRNTHQVSVLNLWDQQQWFEAISKSKTDYILIAYQDVGAPQVVCGPIGIFKIQDIDWISRAGNIGYDLFEAYRGKRLATPLIEAGTDFCFRALNLRRLTAEVLNNNTPSLKAITKAGFVQEGIKREAIIREGSVLDSIMFGKLK